MQAQDRLFTITGQGGLLHALPLLQRPGLQVLFWKQNRPYPEKYYFEIHKPYIELEMHLKGKNRYTIKNDQEESLLADTQPGFWYFSVFQKCEGEIELQPNEQGVNLSIIMEPRDLMQNSEYMASLLLPFLKRISYAPPAEPGLQAGPMSAAMFAIASQMMECPFASPARELFLEAKAMELIATQVHLLTQKDEAHIMGGLENKEAGAVHRAREILLANLNNPPKLDDLAKQVGLNRNKLTRGFREIYGLTAFEMLRSERLERAKAFLRTSRMSLADIAHASGYCAQSHFTSAFTAQFGVSPGQFRKDFHH